MRNFVVALLLTAVVAAYLLSLHYAHAAEQLGPEGESLSTCILKVADARKTAQDNAAALGSRYFELADDQAKKLTDGINAKPPVTDIKADLWLIQEGDDTVLIARAYKGCVLDVAQMRKDQWNQMIQDIFGSAT